MPSGRDTKDVGLNMDNKKQQGSRKQITFDLSQKALAEHYPRPKYTINPRYYKKAYSDISRFMKKNGFEHRQFSVYTSIDRLTAAKVSALIKKMSMEMPWLAYSVNQIDVTNIGTQHSLLQTLEQTTTLQVERTILPIEPSEEKIPPQPDLQELRAQIIAEAKQEAADLLQSITQDPTEGRRR